MRKGKTDADWEEVWACAPEAAWAAWRSRVGRSTSGSWQPCRPASLLSFHMAFPWLRRWASIGSRLPGMRAWRKDDALLEPSSVTICVMAISARLSLGNFVAPLTWAAVRASVYLIVWVKTVGSLALSAPSVPHQLTRDSLAFLEEACRRADVGRPFIAYFIRHVIGREGKACRQLGAWTESRLGARRLIHFHGRPDTNREVRGYAASGIWGHLPPSALLHQAQASSFSSQAKPHPISNCKQFVRRFSEQTCPCPVQTCLHCRPRFLPCQARFRQ